MNSDDGAKLKFHCQKSGNCCVSRGTAGYVFLTDHDIERLGPHAIHVRWGDFTLTGTVAHDPPKAMAYLPPGTCMFLGPDRRCNIYDRRPAQCRTWPFWPENFNSKGWTDDVRRFCPGIDKESAP